MNINSKKSLIIIIITALLGGISYFTFIPNETPHSFEQIKTLADQGDADAQYNLGSIYYFGKGITKNYQIAFEWYKKAAEQGHAQAQENLGSMYYRKGTTENDQKAIKWFTKAAEQGDVEAQIMLGLIYDQGFITKKNVRKAFKWYKKVVEQGRGSRWTFLRVGYMYYHGEGTTKNYKKAFKWFKKSARLGDGESNFYLANMYYNGKGTTKNYKKAYTHFLICNYLKYKQENVYEFINQLEKEISPKAITEAQDEAEKMIQGFKKTDD